MTADWVDKVRSLVIVAAKSVSHLTEFADYWVHEPQWNALSGVTCGGELWCVGCNVSVAVYTQDIMKRKNLHWIHAVCLTIDSSRLFYTAHWKVNRER